MHKVLPLKDVGQEEKIVHLIPQEAGWHYGLEPC